MIDIFEKFTFKKLRYIILSLKYELKHKCMISLIYNKVNRNSINLSDRFLKWSSWKSINAYIGSLFKKKVTPPYDYWK